MHLRVSRCKCVYICICASGEGAVLESALLVFDKRVFSLDGVDVCGAAQAASCQVGEKTSRERGNGPVVPMKTTVAQALQVC